MIYAVCNTLCNVSIFYIQTVKYAKLLSAVFIIIIFSSEVINHYQETRPRLAEKMSLHRI